MSLGLSRQSVDVYASEYGLHLYTLMKKQALVKCPTSRNTTWEFSADLCAMDEVFSGTQRVSNVSN